MPEDETPIDMKTAAKFYHCCFDKHTRVEVAQKICSYIQRKSDMKLTLQEVVDRFNKR